MLTQERLKYLLDYDQYTGVFVWKNPTSSRVRRGDHAGTVNPKGYIIICADRKTYRASRLAWLYMTGYWPIGQVDHRNTVRGDNSWNNLRDVTGFVNQQNRRGANSNSTSGLIGVSKATKGGWFARIHRNGKGEYLGYYQSAEAAHEAYLRAKKEFAEAA